MSFKYRLRTFFILLTVVPLLAAGYTVQRVLGQNRASRVDSGLAAALQSVLAVYAKDQAVAVSAVRRLAADEDVRAAVSEPGGPDRSALEIALGRQNSRELNLELAVTSPDGEILVGSRADGPRFEAERILQGGNGLELARVVASVPIDAAFARSLSAGPQDVSVAFLVGQEAITERGPQPAQVGPLPERGAVVGRIGGESFRMAAVQLADSTSADGGEPVEALALYSQAELNDATRTTRIKVLAATLAALAAILALSEFLLRSITGQIGLFARRARAVGEGDFSGRIPVQGNDEFARFGDAFNLMSSELEQRIGDLKEERERVRRAFQRFGSALESSHNVSALYKIVVESALEAVSAGGGRLAIVDETGVPKEVLRLGTAELAPEEVLPAQIRHGGQGGLEGLVLREREPATQVDPPMLAAPLRVRTDSTPMGLLTLLDPARGVFTEDDVQTVRSLAMQGAVAIDNANLHRLTQTQAKTDGLTGLANHREFQEQLRRELERAQRFDQPLALILFDLDDFKLVNDRFGHLTGNAVLRYVARVARECIREIDLAARPGGEEFAVLLPGTTAEGATRVAERMRESIATGPSAQAEGRNVAVTASFGVAARPADATTQVELVAAADRALYAAKDAGKNRVIRASALGRPGGRGSSKSQ